MSERSSKKSKSIATLSSRICELRTLKGTVTLPFELRRSHRSRYMRICVTDANQVILRVPQRASESSALEFLHSQADWIIAALERVPQRLTLVEYLRAHPWISTNGSKVPVEITSSHVRTHWVLGGNPPGVVICCKSAADANAEIRNALVEIAAQELPGRVRKLAEQVGAHVKRVSVRDQRTLWGSCSSSGTLSINWRLIMLPPELQDHIIFHELAHITHMDHSRAFYRLLQEYDPLTPEHDHRVSKLSPEIMALGR